MSLLLEVSVTGTHDIAGALGGGADRLSLVQPTSDGGMSPDLPSARIVLQESSVPVRVMLRLTEGFTTTGGEFTRLVGLAEEYLAMGAEGLCFGFLNPTLAIDEEVCAALVAELPGVPWTFHRAFDAVLDVTGAWRSLVKLPGLSAVRTAGSPQGLSVGYEELLSLCQASPRAAGLTLPAGGLTTEHVPWFVRAGVCQFSLGRQARPTGSFKAYVDAGLVRSWRDLLDRYDPS
jgi:copper homeostasis protein